MPIPPTYPGIYIEEIPSGVRTITGVATSIAAFIDYFPQGLMNKAIQIFSIGDFEREFGGLDIRSEASYAIQQFFLNGGTEAWVIRTASGGFAAADVEIQSGIEAALALRIQAGRLDPDTHPELINPGTWGNNLRVTIDHLTSSADRFNMTVALVATRNGQQVVLRSETFRGLSMDSGDPTSFVKTVVNDEFSGSKLVRVTASGADLPMQNGTISGQFDDQFPNLTNDEPQMTVRIGDEEEGTARLSAVPTSLTQARNLLESAIRAARPDLKAFAQATVSIFNNRLRILAGPTAANARITFAVAPLDNTTLGELKLAESDVVANVQSYSLGAGNAISNTAQGPGTIGANGDPPNGLALIGDSGAKTGMHALENVDLFNILCIPRTAVVTGNNPLDPIEARTVIVHAINFCEEQRAFFIVDTPTGIDEVQEVKDWLDGSGIPRSRNAAFYFPRVQIPDPLNDFKLKSVGASGTIAGLYARIDSERGVWKAPAGTEATLRNVFKLDVSLTDSENGTLNPLAINCLRTFPVYGTICWGARTLEGANEIGSEYKYVPVRRLALFIEETLYRGLKWVVFEPNDEPLWSQIRLNVGAFMNNLFRQGAFQGRTPREAYLVKCDKETTTQNDIDQGIVNILVGFAPLKPAEFVFLKLQQLTGQIQT